MEYLVYSCKLPVLAYDDKFFYFTDDDVLRKHLKKMPFFLKISSVLIK